MHVDGKDHVVRSMIHLPAAEHRARLTDTGLSIWSIVVRRPSPTTSRV